MSQNTFVVVNQTNVINLGLDPAVASALDPCALAGLGEAAGEFASECADYAAAPAGESLTASSRADCTTSEALATQRTRAPPCRVK